MVGKTTAELQQEGDLVREDLLALLPPDLVHAPYLDWSSVDARHIRYLYNEVRETPWFHQLAFFIAILTTYTRLDRATVEGRLYGLHARLRAIFSHYHLTRFEEWNPVEHLIQYMSDPDLSDSFESRQLFLQDYATITRHTAAYLRSLTAEEHRSYQRWIFPPLAPDLQRSLSRWGIWRAEQQQRRKEETDALAPHLAQIRGEAHFRWNQLKRLRDKFHEVTALVESGQETLPVFFSYEEPRLEQRLHLCLWDRYSFMENHFNQYLKPTQRECRYRVRGYAPEKNHFFLEFLYAENVTDGSGDPNTLLWFGDLLWYGLLGQGPACGTQEEIQRKQDYLRSWGYGEEKQTGASRPFQTDIAELLVWSKSQEHFLLEAQKRSKGLLFLVEPLYAAATFGLAALDFFTTTGARNGELIQLSLDRDCLYTVEIEGVLRYLVRLIPKNADKPADYVVGTETRKNLEHVGDLLQDLYRLQQGDPLPQVPFNPRNHRAHCFKKSRPYLFQYNKTHFSETDVNACMRFLCHGLVFQTAEGRAVVLNAHALRHIFATHLHQVEGVPLDVIAVMLHQKNVQVTAYYAAPPWQQVLTTANSLLDKFATHLGSIEDAFVRAPAELQRQLEEAKAKVGTLNTVPGGQCTCHAICPIAFACTGCVYNVPDPNREEEIIEQEHWALIRLDQVKRRGLGPEIVKALIQRCKVTRKEMKLMRVYRKDETYEPTLSIEYKRADESPLAETVLPDQATKNG